MSRYPLALPVTEYVWRQIDQQGPLHNDGTQCWMWLGHRDRGGYGRASVRGQNALLVHRLIYVALVGEPPKGLTLDHLCRRRTCVNPEHLEPVTIAENTRRGMAGWNMRAKTHCPQGHAYAGDNLAVYPRPDGGFLRRCRTCAREANQRYEMRLKEAA